MSVASTSQPSELMARLMKGVVGYVADTCNTDVRGQSNATSKLNCSRRLLRIDWFEFVMHLSKIHGETLSAQPERSSIRYAI